MNDKLLLENINYKEWDSILSLWKKIFSINKNNDFLYDELFWNQTKKDFMIKAFLISKYIKKIEWKYIGIMLPAVGSSSILIIATYLAWKVPVMFNWTLSKDSFDHCFSFSKVNKILTATSFYDKINTNFLKPYKDKWDFIFLDKLLKNITIFEKISAYLKSFYCPINNLKATDEAVVLFTSWTESKPKAISLNHENIIENIIESISIFKVKKDDILLWFLPPFHSFWFTVNSILPLITGLKLVNSPDPNDAISIVNLIKIKKITAITATPTFLKMIIKWSNKEDLLSLKYVVVWSEKCSAEVFKSFANISEKWQILEGYWITECSPVISINPIDTNKIWTVGKILWNLKYKIIDFESNKELTNWEDWLLYISWKSIFNWYLDKNIKNPFIDIDWKKYYNTWDVWSVDWEWYFTISWRVKRFIKIAWEMISLLFIENVLSEKFNSDTNQIAIEWLESDNKAKIVLFSIAELNINEVNNYLREKEVSNIIKISEIILVKKIPVLWTWKTNYQELKKLIKIQDKDVYKIKKNWTLEENLIKKIKELSWEENIIILPDSIFGKDIHLDSIDVGELMIFIRKQYNISSDIKISHIKTFSELVNLVKNNKWT